MKAEGYWRSRKSEKSNLPWPIARDKPWKGRRAFLFAFASLNVRNGKRCKGYSQCRICGETLGSCDTILSANSSNMQWTVPEKYIHYVKAHNVKPSDAFIKWVIRHGSKLPKT